jgi:hypothetical protein
MAGPTGRVGSRSGLRDLQRSTVLCAGLEVANRVATGDNPVEDCHGLQM